MDFESITGWHHSSTNKDDNFCLHIGDYIFPVEASRHIREDVAKAYGHDYMESGFDISLSPQIKVILENALIDTQPVYLSKSGVKIDFLCEIPCIDTSYEDLNVQLVPMKTSIGNKLKIWISQWGMFRLQFKLSCSTHIENIPTITIDDTSIRTTVINKQIVKDDDLEELSLLIELPGYALRGITEASPALIGVTFNDNYSLEKPIPITIQDVTSWLISISNLNNHSDKQHLSLLALEVLQNSRIFSDLPYDTQRYYLQFREDMDLSSYVGNLSTSGKPGFERQDQYNEASHLWGLLKELNAAIDSGQDYASTAESLLASIPDNQGLQISLIKSIIPGLCTEDSLERLLTTPRIKNLFDQLDLNNTWEASLSLPILLLNDKIAETGLVLKQIAANKDNNWLSTECIYYFVKKITSSESTVDIHQISDLFLTYATLLESLHTDRYSRIYDVHLISAAICWIEYSLINPEIDHGQVTNTLLSHYGLSNIFWNKLCTNTEEHISSNIQQSFLHWQRINDYFQKPAITLDDWIITSESITYFLDIGNSDAARFLSESISFYIAHNPDDINQLLEYIHANNANPNLILKILASSLNSLDTTNEVNIRFTDSLDHAIRNSNISTISPYYHDQLNFTAYLRDKAHHKIPNPASNKFFSKLFSDEANFIGYDCATSYFLKNNSCNLFAFINLYKLRNILSRNQSAPTQPAPLLAARTNTYNHLKNTKYNFLINKLDGKTKTTQHCEITKPYFPSDTLVLIYSCNKYLSDRIESIRRTWLQDLKRRQIPYLVIVGNGDDTIDGDILRLNVNDDYESLPQKTLKAFEWAFNNTDAQYVIKIDDDCLLNVDLFFDSLSYRKHHYYGGVLHRGIGQTNRTWHQSYSKSRYGQESLDKSPEPTIYARGGTYSLSRLALGELIKARSSTLGQRIAATSFMEDKLVGDLLFLRQIYPDNEDFHNYNRKRTGPDALPVGIWDNAFFPSKVTPIKAVHLDNADDQQHAYELLSSNFLLPQKIWSSNHPATIGYNRNQLDLLSSSHKVRQINSSSHFVVSVVRNERTILPYFLDHYRKLGFTAFIFADNLSDDGTREYLLKQDDVILYSVDTEYRMSHYGVEWQHAILSNHCINKWALLADADEFLLLQDSNSSTIKQYTDTLDHQQYDCAQVNMLDMYPYNNLSDADFEVSSPFECAQYHDKEPYIHWHIGKGNYSNTTCYLSGLRHRIIKSAEPNAFLTQKYPLIRYKPWMYFSEGIHFATGVNTAPKPLQFAHFKYHSGFKSKVSEEIARNQHYANAKEYRQYQSMIKESEGKFGDKKLSKRLDLS